MTAPRDAAPAIGDLLFLYGTLRHGGEQARRLGLPRASVPLGPAAMAGALYDLGDYPGLVQSGRGRVQGQLVRLSDPRIFIALDRYEAFEPAAPERSLFVRLRAPLLGRRDSAWVYVYNRSVAGRPLVPSGLWRG